MSFYQRLISETTSARNNFQTIPIITSTIQNGITPGLYAKYLEQAYHHVRYTVPLLSLALKHCGTNDKVYAKALKEYIAEETGHEEWILNDIAALGFDKESVRIGRGGFACRMMVAYAHYAIEHITPYALLGMVHVLEGMSVALAKNAADAIGKSISTSFNGVPPNAFSYLTSHGSLDIDHVKFFEDTVNAIEDINIQNVIVDSANDFYTLFGNIFRELGKLAEAEKDA
ncbi:MAG: iron-containing redox enzyme family protein [Rhodospirillaceae bacterium]|nr:iron-containing redox enzyme family protein [Rhodospirillaceae bacterium]